MPIQRRFSAPETLLPRIRKEDELPALVCDPDFIDWITKFPKIGSLWYPADLRRLFVRPLEQREWIVNTYPMFLRTMYGFQGGKRNRESSPLQIITGLTVFARVAQQPEFPQFARIESNILSERLERVAALVQLLAKNRWTPHVEDHEQAGNP
jgi:hypothetical protein